MKERPVIFNGEMVRAILDGRKTQTRRVMKVQPKPSETRPGDFWFSAKKLESMVHVSDFTPGNSPIADCHLFFQEHCCPFGQVGDRLWVRETFAVLGNEDGCPIDWDGNLIKGDEKQAARIYKASCWQEPGNYGLWSIPDRDTQYEGAWRPSIHMPRWASRITLEITGVRVERLNDISEEDARAEGVKAGVSPGHEHMMHQVAFSELWQSIYGAESWSANPWVWVIEFRRVGDSAREVERGKAD
ncbi:hypothetical protein ATE40_007350 [Serratia surfactantfaciens]|uniref:hypothetical protein n=1 Tax=Serratia surfactantfaciens TaxID=2741499 RepID=UPI0007C85089|nr:hypothetical protein [Serratia surfactantfaciens]AOE99073.1 hypothetical protein ATE40_007350 [Serratia surfactantfaciens]